MRLLILFIVFFSAQILAFEELESRIQNYFKSSQIQLLRSIESSELEIRAAHNDFSKHLESIKHEQDQILTEIHQVNQSFTPTVMPQYLSVDQKHCFHQYASQIVTQNNAKLQLQICHDNAKLEIEVTKAKGQSWLNAAKSYAIGQFLEDVRTCSSLHLSNETALELCYNEKVELATKTVKSHLNSVQEYLEKSLHESSVVLNNAIQCSYEVGSEVLKALGLFLKDIENCKRNFIQQTIQSKRSSMFLKMKLKLIKFENPKIGTENMVF